LEIQCWSEKGSLIKNDNHVIKNHLSVAESFKIVILGVFVVESKRQVAEKFILP